MVHRKDHLGVPIEVVADYSRSIESSETKRKQAQESVLRAIGKWLAKRPIKNRALDQ